MASARHHATQIEPHAADERKLCRRRKGQIAFDLRLDLDDGPVRQGPGGYVNEDTARAFNPPAGQDTTLHSK